MDVSGDALSARVEKTRIQREGKKAKNKCAYRGCAEAAVGSHTISKERVLRSLAEGGKVLAPKVQLAGRDFWKKIAFAPQGIGDASVFRGFCDRHEMLFGALDGVGVSTVQDVLLQMYRTASKFSFRARTAQLCHETSGLANAGDRVEPAVSHLSLGAAADFLAYVLEGESYTQQVLQAGSVISLQTHAGGQLGPEVHCRRLPFAVPAAIETRFLLRLDRRVVEVFAVVIPEDGETMVMAMCDPSFSNRVRTQLRTDVAAVLFAERAFMTGGSFALSPSVAHGWGERKTRFVEEDYFFAFERGFEEPLGYRLFDDVWLHLTGEVIALEELPTRDPIESRKRRMFANRFKF